MRVATILFILLTVTVPGHADFESASEAYRNQNYSQAYNEFLQMAEAGDARAQTVLAIMYKYGESVPIDYAKSYDWYQKAAVQGYPPAQYNVGIMLAEGLGVTANSEQAVTWLTKAADAGYDRAHDRIAEVTGDQTLKLLDDEPVAWSKSWNLRLPNDIRFDRAAPVNSDLRVYRVQLGAMSTLEAAQRLWDQISAQNPFLFEVYQPIFRETEREDKTIYRIQVGTFDAEAEADHYCDEVKQTTASRCLVVLTH